MNIKVLLLLTTLFCTHFVWAQKYGEIPALPDPFADRFCLSSFDRVELNATDNTEQVLIDYLNTNNSNFRSLESQPVLEYHKSSLGGEHFNFRQNYKGIRVYNSDVKINMDKTGAIISVFDNSYPSKNWPDGIDSEASEMDGLVLGKTLAQQQGYPEAEIIEHTVLAVVDDEVLALKEIELFDFSTATHRLFLVQKDLEIILEQDLNRYSNRSLVTAMVFAPDPLTTAGQLKYLSPYIDSNDAEIPELNIQRKSVLMDVLFDGNQYYLENDWIKIMEFSAPAKDTFTFFTPDFDFTRGQDQFESVNAYYHLTRFNNYIRDSLGMSDLSDFTVQVDPHALNGNDNSMFSSGGGNPRLFFGEGGVDDAEDADVIVHEYGHALSNQAVPGGNSGGDRPALDEGFGDYLAASYSRAYSEFRWADVFTWDGHGVWDGRTADFDSIYEAPLDWGTIHTRGQMWSSSLMEIWGFLGRKKSDVLALQTLYGFARNISFPDAARVYLQANDLLYSGADGKLIHNIFWLRGFLEYPVGINEEPFTSTTIQLKNTQGFAYAGQPVTIVSQIPLQSIKLFDLTGKLVLDTPANQQAIMELDGGNLPQGAYILKVFTENGYTSTHKLLKAQ